MALVALIGNPDAVLVVRVAAIRDLLFAVLDIDLLPRDELHDEGVIHARRAACPFRVSLIGSM